MNTPKRAPKRRTRGQWLAAALWGTTALSLYASPALAQAPDEPPPEDPSVTNDGLPDGLPPDGPPDDPEPLPHVKIAAPVYGGPPADASPPDLSSAAVQRVIKQHTGKLRACHEDVLKTDPTVKGTIKLAFTINTNGKTSDVTIRSNDTGSEPFAQCVIGVVQKFRFPAPDTAKKVVYPFKFEAPAADLPEPTTKKPGSKGSTP